MKEAKRIYGVVVAECEFCVIVIAMNKSTTTTKTKKTKFKLPNRLRDYTISVRDTRRSKTNSKGKLIKVEGSKVKVLWPTGRTAEIALKRLPKNYRIERKERNSALLSW